MGFPLRPGGGITARGGFVCVCRITQRVPPVSKKHQKRRTSPAEKAGAGEGEGEEQEEEEAEEAEEDPHKAAKKRRRSNGSRGEVCPDVQMHFLCLLTNKVEILNSATPSEFSLTFLHIFCALSFKSFKN